MKFGHESKIPDFPFGISCLLPRLHCLAWTHKVMDEAADGRVTAGGKTSVRTGKKGGRLPPASGEISF